jgi:hypothetical protein
MKKRNAILCGITSISALVAASGCGMIKNLNDMHDATNNMADTTQQMNKQMQTTNEQIGNTNTTTTHMANTTDHMATNVAATACTAEETYTALRQGNTLQARSGDDMLARMDSAHAIEMKIFAAGAYMKAFEFQIPNCALPDDDRKKVLATFYMEAAEEFTRILPNYLTTDKTKWSVSPTSTGNQANDVYALAVSLQELNANMVAAYKDGRIVEQPQSLLDLIESSFTRKTYLAAHPDEATLMDHEFLANEDLLLQLMQIRMNFLATMSLAKVSNLEEKGTLGFPGLIREIKMLFGGWTPNLRQYGSQDDVERIKEFTRYLYGSNDIRAYLESIGVKPNFDGTVMKIYSHMRTSDAVQPLIKDPKTDADLAFNNTQIELGKYLEQLDIFFGRKEFKKIPALDHPEFYSY